MTVIHYDCIHRCRTHFKIVVTERDFSAIQRFGVCFSLCVCWSCLLDLVINIIYSISLLFMCKLRGFRNVVVVLLLGRSFHEVKESSCPSPVTAPTDTTHRDYIWNERSLKFMVDFLNGVQDECTSVSAPSPFRHTSML